MQELIPLQTSVVDGDTKQTVNARDLHAFLECQTKFADWIARRVSEYAFTQDVDFVVILNSEKNLNGRPLKDYHLTLDMAKELSMVERSAKGKEARLYFIECERIAKDFSGRLPKDPTLAMIVQLAMETDSLKTKLANLSSNTKAIRDVTQKVAANFERRIAHLENVATTQVKDPAPITRGSTRKPPRYRKGMMTPSEVGQHFDITGRRVNGILTELGLVNDVTPKHSKRRVYELTYLGRAYGMPTHTNGDLIPEGSKAMGAKHARTVIWMPEVLSVIAEHLATEA